jgi:hypothetical protein
MAAACGHGGACSPWWRSSAGASAIRPGSPRRDLLATDLLPGTAGADAHSGNAAGARFWAKLRMLDSRSYTNNIGSIMRYLRNALLLLCAGTSLALAQNPPGEKWQISTSMQMSGMSMPAMSSEICKQPGDDSVPVKQDKNCEVYDVSRTGNTQRFKMRCTGKESMEGSGEFTYLGPDHYQGKMLVSTQGESMTMNMEGRKIGACDGGEINLQAKKMQAQAQVQMAQSQKMMAEQCHQFAAEGSTPSVFKTICTDPEDRKVFCATVQKHDSFQNLSMMQAQAQGKRAEGTHPLSEAEELCGFSADAVRGRLCGTAEQNGKWKFLSDECPVQAAALAQTQCAGRSYTSISDRYRQFCSNYASEQERAQQQTPTGKAKGLFGKGKKALGGLLGN